MATVINLPPSQNDLGAGLGQGVGMGLMRHIQKEEMKEKSRRAQQFMLQIRNARDERELGDVQANLLSSDLIEDTDDLATINRAVQTRRAELELVPLPGVGPEGKEETRFVPREQMTPGGIQEMTDMGFRPGGKPDPRYDFYKMEGDKPVLVGNLPLSQRPPETVTAEELMQARQGRGEQRAAEEHTRGAERLALAQRADRREESSAAATAQHRTDQTVRQAEQDQRQKINDASDELTTLFGEKLEGGGFSLNTQDNKQNYTKAMQEARRLIRTGEAGDGFQAAHKAAEKFLQDKGLDLSDLPPPPKKEEGAFSKWFKDALKSLSGKIDELDPAKKPAAPAKKNGQTAEGKIREGLGKEEVEKMGATFDPAYTYRIGPNGQLQKKKK